MNNTLAFIGAGNMARAIIGGLIDSGFDAARIRAIDPAEEQLKLLPDGVVAGSQPAELIGDVDAVILCVKPNVVADVVAGLAGQLADKLVISVAAGTRSATIAAPLGERAAVVRCMPNTPALVGLGMTGLHASEAVSEDQRRLAETILGAVGEIRWFESEDDLDAVTAVSGSGPAYFFLVMEAMEKAGARLGLDPEAARALVLQTALGAATMAARSDDDPATLRKNVTSPGGTTEAALNELIGAGLEDVFDKALSAAWSRSKALAGNDQG